MTLSFEGGNILIKSQGRSLRLQSSRPEAEARKLAQSISAEADALFLGGAGLGHILEEALALPRLRWVFVAEPSPEIAAFCLEKRPALAALKNNPRVIWVQNHRELEERLGPCEFRELALIIQRTYGELFDEEIRLCGEACASALSRKEVSRNTLVRFGRLWVKNIFRNMPLYLETVKLNRFLGYGQGKPALVIGAGPSLDEALPFLRQCQKKALLIAADTALPMLENAGLCPDFTVTVDPQEQNALYLRLCAHKNHTLIADPGVHPSAFEGYAKGSIALSDAPFPFYGGFMPLWGACGTLASGGSVSTSAFDFARSIGCPRIYLIGQDLAFTSRKTYGAGNLLWELGRAKNTRLSPQDDGQARSSRPAHALEVPSRKGDTVPSDARLSAFAAWFSEEIPRTQAPVFAVGDGALLRGAQNISAAEALSSLEADIDKHFCPPAEDIAPSGLRTLLLRLQCETLGLKTASKMGPEKLAERLAKAPLCARILDIGMQKSVGQALRASAHQKDARRTLLLEDLASGLDHLERVLQKPLEILEANKRSLPA